MDTVQLFTLYIVGVGEVSKAEADALREFAVWK